MSEAAEKFADEIFRAVEDSQGKAFISDGLNALSSAATVFATVRYHLKHARKTVRIIEGFLEKYREEL